ncbi:hypothetical protein FOMPIDRAFT_158974 [Fomitopsis schrenkii]|uniref:Uncharacterized protein n=1 Tax=Fomitopsis schrenkii TaxID=2126942 RepID=S8EIS9_FOMSC|nr:hypothetical protein FOMPIDRAFT_158974 [Fomitopsis schrenkii]
MPPLPGHMRLPFDGFVSYESCHRSNHDCSGIQGHLENLAAVHNIVIPRTVRTVSAVCALLNVHVCDSVCGECSRSVLRLL